MENASKALLMAGGVLIAIITIALLVNTFSTVSQFQMSQLSQKEQEELIAFNEQYTKYLNQYIYGTEVITVINRAKNNTTYPIKVIIKFTTNGYDYAGYVYNEETKRYEKGRVFIKKGGYITIENDEEGNPIVNTFISSLNAEDADGINTMAFKCTKIEYDDSNGRVKSITFEEKQWGNLY